GLGRLVDHQHGDVVHQLTERLGDAVQRFGHQVLEPPQRDLHAGNVAGVGGYAPKVEGEVPAEALLGGLDEAQRAAVTSTAGPLCVHAGAGSGKTRVLTRRIAYRAAEGDLDPGHAVALTFTRKAAGELRTRLRALGLPQDVAAGTFHAIAYAQLRGWWE